MTSAVESKDMLYIRVAPQHIADVNWIMEGYEHLALVGTVDGKAGLVKLYATPDTYADVVKIVENMPFAVEIIENFTNEW